MDHNNNNTNSTKNKHLSYKERIIIETRLKDGWSPYKIAKYLNRAQNTILNEIRRGTTIQIKQGKSVKMYLADTGEAVYRKHRKNSVKPYKLLKCRDFINYVNKQFKEESWSLDSCVGEALNSGKFERSETVCTKTLYNYTDLGFLKITNTDLPLKLHRNQKSARVKANKKNLGRSIEERPKEIEKRLEFGHWEIDTVVGVKDKEDCVLMTLVERKTRYAIVIKIASKTANAVMNAIKQLQDIFSEHFSDIFKTITGDNGSEFSNLSYLDKITATRVFFTHPYASFEKGTNERHNGLIRRFIPKGNKNSYQTLILFFLY